jgi:hypothetical protein
VRRRVQQFKHALIKLPILTPHSERPRHGGHDFLNEQYVWRGTEELADPVAIDAYVAKAYWDLDPQHLPYLQMAAARGLGTVDFASLAAKLSQLG